MGTPPIPPARPRPLTEKDEMDLEAAFQYALHANPFEYWRVRFEHWLVGAIWDRSPRTAEKEPDMGMVPPRLILPRRYITNEFGGLTDVTNLEPIMQVGNPDPVAYIDRDGRFYPVEKPPAIPQYEECLVEYEY